MKQEKVTSILETSRKMFARYGPKKTSIDEMARLARVAKATIYNYFGSKEGVYLEVLRREKDGLLKKLSDSVDEESLPSDKLIVFVKKKFRYMREAINILNLDREGIESLIPSTEGIRNELFEREVDIIHSILKDGVENGIFYLKYPLVTAKAIAHALRGFELHWLIQESEENIDYYLDEFMNILSYGIVSPKKGAAV